MFEQIKLAILIFACIIDTVAFVRESSKNNYKKALVYLGLSVCFCYLLAGYILNGVGL